MRGNSLISFLSMQQTIPLYVILSEVEVFLSEERGKTEERQRRRDLRTNFGSSLHRCYIPSASHQDSLRDPASPCGSRFCLAIRSAEVRQAQDDKLIDFSVVFVKNNGRFTIHPFGTQKGTDLRSVPHFFSYSLPSPKARPIHRQT